MNVVEMHTGKPFLYWLTCVAVFSLGIALLIVSHYQNHGNWMLIGTALFFSFAGGALMIRPQTVVEEKDRSIHRIFQLFGRFNLWSRDYRSSDFSHILVQRPRQVSGHIDPDGDIHYLYLCRRAGRKILFSYFHTAAGKDCQPITDLARSLAASLDLPIEQREE